jgi:hypothetical protein
MAGVQEWSRSEAERRIRELFDKAKSGTVQQVQDPEGVLEIRFLKLDKPSAGSYLARGLSEDRT